MITLEPYQTDHGASHALVARLTNSLNDATAKPIAEGDGWATYPSGETITWEAHLYRPVRRTGSASFADPASFVAYVTRLAAPETTVWADKAGERLVAVFDDHPANPGGLDAPDAEAGWRKHTAVLDLVPHEDWTAWVSLNDRPMSQAAFGEHVEALAHTIVEPSSATMLEVATTLTGRQAIDFGSRVRLDNGDVEFKFEQTSTMSAGRGSTSIEIPTKFTIQSAVWEGLPPARVDARLRTRAGQDGVRMAYKLIRVSDFVDTAFQFVLSMITERLGDGIPVYSGNPFGGSPSRR